MEVIQILSILILTAILGSVLSSQSITDLGCFIDKGEDRDLSGSYSKLAVNSPSICADVCRSGGYRYAGVQHSNECACGNEYGAYGQAAATDCNMECKGNTDKLCGAGNRNSVYEIADQKAYELAYLGCFIDKTEDRDLKGSYSNLDKNSPFICADLCKRSGYRYAGVQHSNECACGNEYGAHGKVAESECNMKCKGNEDMLCGRGYRNSVYEIADQKDNGITELGCFKDKVDDRDLKGTYSKLAVNSPSICADLCKIGGYKYAGVQYSSYCLCGNEYGAHGQAPGTDCEMVCKGTADKLCGGESRNSIYEIVNPDETQPTENVQMKYGLPYLGCFIDKEEARDLEHMSPKWSKNLPSRCVAYCKNRGKKYAGLQNGYYCTCGNQYGAHGKTAETNCNMQCPGYEDKECGGYGHNAVYKTAGFVKTQSTECWGDDVDYIGTQNQAVGNRDCQRWDAITHTSIYNYGPHLFPENSVADAKNYCRNPNNVENGPYCHTTEISETLMTCGISNCYHDKHHWEY